MTRVLSCIQPTGDVHLGNYLGALRNWAIGQHEWDAFHGIVDLHALTVPQEPGLVGRQTIELAALLFAVGLDPDVATVFKDAESVNETLRAVARIIDIQSHKGRTASRTGRSRRRPRAGRA